MSTAPRPDPVPRVGDWTRLPSGHVMTVRCRGCGHRAALPVALLLQRHGASAPADRVAASLRCGACRGRAVEIRSARLCDPGCARQRG